MTRVDYDIVLTVDGIKQRMNVEGFLALPLDARIRAVLEHRVQFFRGGDSVPATEALNAIRKASSVH